MNHRLSNKAELKQYFTDAEEINALMCKLLGPVDGLTILEPSVGHGALLKGLDGNPARIDAVDVDAAALKMFKEETIHDNVNLFHCDFIDVFKNKSLHTHELLKNHYDAVISNPPYGLYLDVDYRRELKKTFPHLYVRESFGLFFAFSIYCLHKLGKYVFLIPDTFLTSKNHTPLRRFISDECAPTHIVRFPSKKFETVKFGYGNLCIIAGEKRPLIGNDEVLWLDATGSDSDISLSAIERSERLKGSFLLEHVDTGWSLTGHAHKSLTVNDWPTLGSLAECRTGIYTGDNVRFIGYDPARIKRKVNGHPILWGERVHVHELLEEEKTQGLRHDSYVPLVRGGHRKCFEEPTSAIKWCSESVTYYKTDKKARFQNSNYYFAKGISIPMVSSNRISAALMDNSVFDQGVVGVFPTDHQLIAPLLIYLNSSFASRVMKGLVNGSANNSANYIKKLPVPRFTEEEIIRAESILASARIVGDLTNDLCDEFVESLTDRSTSRDTQSN